MRWIQVSTKSLNVYKLNYENICIVCLLEYASVKINNCLPYYSVYSLSESESFIAKYAYTYKEFVFASSAQTE